MQSASSGSTTQLELAKSFFLRSLNTISSKETTMSRLFKGTSRGLLAVFGLLLVGGAVAFAQHNATLARILTGPAKTAAVAGQ